MSDCHVPQISINHIERSVQQIGHTVGQLEQLQVALHQTVEQVASTQDMTRSELNELRELFDNFLLRDELARNLQLAQTQIIAVRQELDTAYGHFATVRRLATGTLQAMDTGVVTQEAVQAASEELMITTPCYWLAPALVGLAAWIRDDRPLAERALGEALRRDNDKTSLFFALILRRQHRDGATARWLRQYVARQDSARLSQEFTVVLDAVATGALGSEAKPLVMGHIVQWYERLCADQDVVAAQVSRWRELIDGMRTPVDPGFTVLPAISPTWPALKDLFEATTVHGNAEQHFRGIFDRPLQPAPGLAQRVDDILDSLVTSYDEEEAPHRRRASELQAVIDHDGDKVAAAKAVTAQQAVHDSTVDFLTLLTNAGFFPDKVGASDGTQRLAIALAKDWIVSASGQQEADNLAALPSGVELTVEGWSGRIDQNATEQQLVQSLATHIDTETHRQVAAVRFTGRPLAAAIGAGIAVLLALISAVQGGSGFAVFMVLMAVVVGGWAGYQYTQLQPQRDHLRRLGEQRKATACAQVRGAIAETIDWRSGWDQEIAKATGFRAYMNALTRDSFVAATPDRAREVLA
jgi:hypothetical protein